jgi:hypothetical protein
MSEEKIAGLAYALQPMLSVGNGARAVDFYKRAFGAAEVFRIEDLSGAVVARLSVKSAEFWLSDESAEHANFSPETLGGSTTRMVLIVPDPRDHVAWVAAEPVGGNRRTARISSTCRKTTVGCSSVRWREGTLEKS